MKKINIVRKNSDFNRIIKTGKFVKNDYYVIYFMKNELSNYRFGISVSKKLGNAVFRNKYKRKIRNIIDSYKKLYQNDTDYIIIIRKGCIDVDFNIMESKFCTLINKIQ